MVCKDIGPETAPTLPAHRDQTPLPPTCSSLLEETPSGKPLCFTDPPCPQSPPPPQNCPKTLDVQPHHKRVSSNTEKFSDIIKVPCNYQNVSLTRDDDNVKGSLKSHIDFWRDIGAQGMVLSIVNKGFRIWFTQYPPSMFFHNNVSASRNSAFVTKTILELLSSHRIKEVLSLSYVTSPLSVVCQSSNKKRLILDLSQLNKYVQKDHFKIDDWKIGLQFFDSNALLFSFDLKSGYHHVDIAPQYHKYLGFSWCIDGLQRHFEFTVLPFGLTSAPFIFTKIMKPMVTHWRSCGILVALYLDDGFVVVPRANLSQENHLKLATEVSAHVRSDLLNAGFIYNINKSVWVPTPSITWLGMIWDSNLGTLKVLPRRIDKISDSIRSLQHSPTSTVRELHSFVGQIISMSPVVGNVTRLMTRNSQAVIAQANDENEIIVLNDQCHLELTFWSDNVSRLNTRYVFASQLINKIICSDASSVGSGAIICYDNHTAHKNWTPEERSWSSSHRERETILFALRSFLPFISNSHVKLFTDSQAAAFHVGSMKSNLQFLAFDIFQFCLSNRIRLSVDWIPCSQNEQADFISKFIDVDDWSLSEEFFTSIKTLQ